MNLEESSSWGAASRKTATGHESGQSITGSRKEYTQVKKVRKILRALTSDWEKKTTVIKEANDLSTMSLENLIGNLMAYEVQLEDKKKDEQKPFSKKKELTFHASSDIDNSDDDEEEMAMLSRKFRKFLK